MDLFIRPLFITVKWLLITGICNIAYYQPINIMPIYRQWLSNRLWGLWGCKEQLKRKCRKRNNRYRSSMKCTKKLYHPHIITQKHETCCYHYKWFIHQQGIIISTCFQNVCLDLLQASLFYISSLLYLPQDIYH